MMEKIVYHIDKSKEGDSPNISNWISFILFVFPVISLNIKKIWQVKEMLNKAEKLKCLHKMYNKNG